MLPKFNHDWGYLKKYEAANLQRKSEPNSGNRIVFFGDSITEFWDKHSPTFFENNDRINRGISGQTSSQMLVRFRSDVIDLKPNKLVLLAGANDIAGNTGTISLMQITCNIQTMIELAKVHHIEVILCSVLPAEHFPWKKNHNPSQEIIALNQLLKSTTLEYKIKYVDYYSEMANDSGGIIASLSYDDAHPNELGYQIMESVLMPHL
jgi:lysophospholipase L1-like esterase